MRFSGVLFTMAALGAPLTAAAQAPSATAQLPSITLPAQLDRVLRDYETAWRASDAAGLANLFVDGRVVMTNSGRAVTGRAAVREVYSRGGGPLFLRAVSYAMDDTVAFIIGGYAVREGENDAGTYVLTLVRPNPGAKWLISADMDRAHRR
jgi:hypothetical protein